MAGNWDSAYYIHAASWAESLCACSCRGQESNRASPSHVSPPSHNILPGSRTSSYSESKLWKTLLLQIPLVCHSLYLNLHNQWRICWILSHFRKGGEGLRRLLMQGKGKARFYLTFMLVNKSYLVSLGWCIKVIKCRHGFLLLGIQRLNFTLVRNFWQECKRPETAERAHMFSETIAFCCCLTCDEFWKLMERVIEIGVYVYIAAMDRWGGLVL